MYDIRLTRPLPEMSVTVSNRGQHGEYPMDVLIVALARRAGCDGILEKRLPYEEKRKDRRWRKR